jgi:hypothetical protein
MKEELKMQRAQKRQEEVLANFEEIKSLIREDEEFKKNNEVINVISNVFVKNNIPLDINPVWLRSYVEFCDSKMQIKKDGYYNLLLMLSLSSMIDAISENVFDSKEAQSQAILQLQNLIKNAKGNQDKPDDAKVMFEILDMDMDELEEKFNESKQGSYDPELFQ